MQKTTVPVRKRAYTLLAFIFLLGGAWTWTNRLPDVNPADAARVQAPHKNFAAPLFTLQSVNGQVVVVNFRAPWCPPCRAEMPALDQVYRAKKNIGLIVLEVDQREDPKSVAAFGNQLNLSLPLLLDADGAISVLYGIRALPTTFFVDRRGIIRDVVVGGPMSRELIESKVNPLLAEEVR